MPPETSVAILGPVPDGRSQSDRQLHLALFVGPNSETKVDIAHWEPSWIRQPIRHYRATAVDAETGIERIRALFDETVSKYAVVPSDERVATGMEAEKNWGTGRLLFRSVVAAILFDTRSGRITASRASPSARSSQFLQVGLKPVEPRRLRLPRR